MGRGRAKAKQTKVARALKSGAPGFEADRLKAGLAGATPSPFSPAFAPEVDEEEDDDPSAVPQDSRR